MRGKGKTRIGQVQRASVSGGRSWCQCTLCVDAERFVLVILVFESAVLVLRNFLGRRC